MTSKSYIQFIIHEAITVHDWRGRITSAELFAARMGSRMYQGTAVQTTQGPHAGAVFSLDKKCDAGHSSVSSLRIPCKYQQTERGASRSRLDYDQSGIYCQNGG
ncbi:hypothetical protein GDO81_010479 [Engystomops pustulosus]|uniref:Uncharacterized protein n=1 Tax=Engystomops pustulosus TaxID=76066 RepID=A0AAV7C0E6_ENGPU|nr:hypothetical protein GDO81_010479 [Engystomops pustulosus]